MSDSFNLCPPFHPTTFLERGVSVPFTTPLLSGSRVRPAEREGLELAVPNPSGGRGQYVLPWAGLGELCRPTLHDRRIQEGVAALRGVTPGSIRRVGRLVAAEGLAGRKAQEAAAQAEARDGEARLLANFHLLLNLVRKVEPPGLEAVPPEREQPAELERRAKRAVAHVAPRLGMEADRVATMLEELATILAGIGLGPDAKQARLPRALARLVALREDMEAWGAQRSDESATAADLIRAAVALTVTCTMTTLADARALVVNPIGLLQRWRADPEAVARTIARPEWLLDGWDAICLIWQEAAGPAAQRAALNEMAQLAPIVPKEAGEWVGNSVVAEATIVFRRMVELNHDWRSGLHVVDLVARNEHLRALAE